MRRPPEPVVPHVYRKVIGGQVAREIRVTPGQSHADAWRAITTPVHVIDNLEILWVSAVPGTVD